MSHLLCFGFGFSAQALAPRLQAAGWRISATSRSPEGLARIAAAAAQPLVFDADLVLPASVTHVLLSAPPGDAGDPVVQMFLPQLQQLSLQWVGYLSTTGVYGDHGGAWVHEDTPLTPNTTRGERRLAAEQAWVASGLPVHLFRLAGIYGPERNVFSSLINGTAKRVIKQGQIFSRIHVQDIAGVVQASIMHPNPGRAYNVCDDEPCPPQDVVTYAAGLLNIAPPPAVDFAQAQLSPMAASFYADSKRVSNQRIKTELGYQLSYPSYREGYQDLLKAFKR